ncbi:MAG TPA: polysaccharide biosynthesis/export family protein [Accumulibacter sp.]|nr:polysaccharide biosynthesis/export family protein [Accumulibacter sp.]HNC16546.1 polysaccharide biosynthesis/export family protein [Accumulibacter sp.]HNG37482.1 polysaccharide biosynthesis/export family protein [Accumulibacter sp.]HNL12445.1 polysaccharide biosynthesis/export family protein [Accumulibacter sp.]HNL76385.1 polysaccharide biosynthesis/export family protein [Accumulibacter sp.]
MRFETNFFVFGWRLVGFNFLFLSVLTGCATHTSWLPSSGPSTTQVVEQQKIDSPIPVLEVNDALARRALAAQRADSFAELLASKAPPGYVVGAGDVLEVSVWEAPPAALFGATMVDARTGVTSTRQTTFPEQIVNANGVINVPFAGAVPVAGKSPQQIETDLVARLRNKANQPQVLVRVIRNMTQMATVVGEVAASTRMPLTAKGERLLDAIAAAGGVRQPVGKVTIQLSRRGKVTSMPLDSVIQDPKQNVYLQPGDVVTALFQPLSFIALGAAGKNEEVNFEAQGITLAQALGRMAGVRDAQADARGLFIFRFEEPGVLKEEGQTWPQTPEGKVPVVYRVDLKDPRAFLVAQNFPMKNKDVVYVANAPAAELQKFLNILTSSLFSVSSLINLTR